MAQDSYLATLKTFSNSEVINFIHIVCLPWSGATRSERNCEGLWRNTSVDLRERHFSSRGAEEPHTKEVFGKEMVNALQGPTPLRSPLTHTSP